MGLAFTAYGFSKNPQCTTSVLDWILNASALQSSSTRNIKIASFAPGSTRSFGFLHVILEKTTIKREKEWTFSRAKVVIFLFAECRIRDVGPKQIIVSSVCLCWRGIWHETADRWQREDFPFIKAYTRTEPPFQSISVRDKKHFLWQVVNENDWCWIDHVTTVYIQSAL